MNTIAERFWTKVDRSAGPDGCWIWHGGTNDKGYGRCNMLDGVMRPATHVSLFLATGERVPDGQIVLHSCDNPPCVNAKHLRPGTQLDNMRDRSEKGRARNQNKGKTHCQYGHEFTPENTAYNCNGGRYCRACNKRNGLARYARIKGAIES